MELDKVKEYMGEKEIASLKQDLAVQKAAELVTSSAE